MTDHGPRAGDPLPPRRGAVVEVPAAVAMAVITGRPQILAGLRHRAATAGLEGAEAVALVDLVRDAIVQAQEDRERYAALADRLSQVRGALKGCMTQVDGLADALRRGERGDELGGPPDDDDPAR